MMMLRQFIDNDNSDSAEKISELEILETKNEIERINVKIKSLHSINLTIFLWSV